MDVVVKPNENKDKYQYKKDLMEECSKQLSLFPELDYSDYKTMPFIPYEFSYKFKDDSGKESTLMIEDWEIFQLYLKYEKKPKLAKEKVIEKYLDDFKKNKDIYFILGTTRQYDGWARNPYVIISVIYPKKKEHPDQLNLFDFMN